MNLSLIPVYKAGGGRWIRTINLKDKSLACYRYTIPQYMYYKFPAAANWIQLAGEEICNTIYELPKYRATC